MALSKDSLYKVSDLLDKMLVRIGQQYKENEYERVKADALSMYKYDPNKSLEKNMINMFEAAKYLDSKDLAAYTSLMNLPLVKVPGNVAENLKVLSKYSKEEQDKLMDRAKTVAKTFGYSLEDLTKFGGRLFSEKDKPTSRYTPRETRFIKGSDLYQQVSKYLSKEEFDALGLDPNGFYNINWTFDKISGEWILESIFNTYNPSEHHSFNRSVISSHSTSATMEDFEIELHDGRIFRISAYTVQEALAKIGVDQSKVKRITKIGQQGSDGYNPYANYEKNKEEEKKEKDKNNQQKK